MYPEYPLSSFLHENNYLSVVWALTLQDFYAGKGDLSMLFASQPSVSKFLLVRQLIGVRNLVEQVKESGPEGCLFIPCAADLTPLKMHENVGLMAYLGLKTIPALVAKKQLTSVKFGEEWLGRFSDEQRKKIRKKLSYFQTTL